MIQVDVFWVYAIGAMFASSAMRQLKKDEGKWYESKYLLFTVFYLAILFVPTAAYLLWRFPHWESMHVFTTLSDVPPWIAVFAAATNILMGVLGYYVAYYFIKRDKKILAVAQVPLGYFIMFFILVYGWDGTGSQRFFWDVYQKGTAFQLNQFVDILAFTYSEVAITLYVMGIFVLPPMMIYPLKWIFKGYKEDSSVKDSASRNPLFVLIAVLFAIFGVGLGGAIVASFICWGFSALTNPIIGMVIGLILFISPMIYLFTKGKPLYKLCMYIIGQ